MQLVWRLAEQACSLAPAGPSAGGDASSGREAPHPGPAPAPLAGPVRWPASGDSESIEGLSGSAGLGPPARARSPGVHSGSSFISSPGAPRRHHPIGSKRMRDPELNRRPPPPGGGRGAAGGGARPQATHGAVTGFRHPPPGLQAVSDRQHYSENLDQKISGSVDIMARIPRRRRRPDSELPA